MVVTEVLRVEGSRADRRLRNRNLVSVGFLNGVSGGAPRVRLSRSGHLHRGGGVGGALRWARRPVPGCSAGRGDRTLNAGTTQVRFLPRELCDAARARPRPAVTVARPGSPGPSAHRAGRSADAPAGRGGRQVS